MEREAGCCLGKTRAQLILPCRYRFKKADGLSVVDPLVPLYCTGLEASHVSHNSRYHVPAVAHGPCSVLSGVPGADEELHALSSSQLSYWILFARGHGTVTGS